MLAQSLSRTPLSLEVYRQADTDLDQVNGPAREEFDYWGNETRNADMPYADRENMQLPLVAVDGFIVPLSKAAMRLGGIRIPATPEISDDSFLVALPSAA